VERGPHVAQGKSLVINEDQAQVLGAVLAKLRRVSGSRFAALISTSGQPIVVSPADDESDTVSLAALAAGSFAATRQLAKLLSERQFTLLFHEGEESNLHVVQVNAQVLLLITFGRDTQVGRVRLYTSRALQALKPVFDGAEDIPEGTAVVHQDYEREAGQALDGLLHDEGG
jgi:predicted regulator of Ras-like GTPase activity (Roadblock/LC7/MglB family)